MADPPSQLNPLPTEKATSLLEGSKTHRHRMTNRALRAQHRLSTLRTAAILNEEHHSTTGGRLLSPENGPFPGGFVRPNNSNDNFPPFPTTNYLQSSLPNGSA